MKAVLILEMPSCCNDCPCFEGEYGSCNYLEKDVEDFLRIDKDCPLKPLPQIKEERLKYLRYLGANARELQCYAIGHDDCIDEILGEEDGTN